MTDLKPCPECEERPWTHESHNLTTVRWWIACECGERTPLYETETEAVEDWNRRAE